MPRRPASITQADVARVMRAADQAWPDGRFRVRVAGGEIVAERIDPGVDQKDRVAPAPDLTPNDGYAF